MATVAVCAICHQSYFWGAQFCPNCGAPVEKSEEAGEGSKGLEAEPRLAFPEEVSLVEIAQILHAIATLPNQRTRPQEGDLEGDYDEWFDGGAVRHVTGYNAYEFRNGVRAWWDVLPYLSVSIELANGARVHVTQAQFRDQKSVTWNLFRNLPVARPARMLRNNVIICPLCDGEKSLFYFADGSFAHWGRPPQIPENCPSVVGTCWGCDGEGFITRERDRELQLYLEWTRDPGSPSLTAPCQEAGRG